MKNREQLIIEASEVISEYVKTHEKAFDLFYCENKFSCSHQCLASMMPHFLRHFTADQAKEGLTGPQWQRLGKKAVNLFMEVTK